MQKRLQNPSIQVKIKEKTMAFETYPQKAGSETFVKYLALYEKNKTPAEIRAEIQNKLVGATGKIVKKY
jgi:hypothetical protein